MRAPRVKILTILLSGLLLTGSIASAQQKSQYTQYIINPYIVNPALTGIENYVDVKASYRQQWAGLEGAPRNLYVTLQGPIGKRDYKTAATSLFPVEGENPRGKQYWDEYTASPAHHGLGIQVISDQIGPFNTFSAYGTYAYHIGISKRTSLSAGIGIGASKVGLNTSKLDYGSATTTANDDIAAARNSGQLGKTKLDMNAGIWIYSANYFIGFSAQQLLPQGLDFSVSSSVAKATEGKLVPHFFTTFGYRFLLSEDINMLPSVMVKTVLPLESQVDVNVKMMYRDAAWVGGSYRGKYGFSAFAGLNAMNMFTVSYSYDYSTTKINSISRGSHEIIIGFILGNKYSDDTCPKNVW